MGVGRRLHRPSLFSDAVSMRPTYGLPRPKDTVAIRVPIAKIEVNSLAVAVAAARGAPRLARGHFPVVAAVPCRRRRRPASQFFRRLATLLVVIQYLRRSGNLRSGARRGRRAGRAQRFLYISRDRAYSSRRGSGATLAAGTIFGLLIWAPRRDQRALASDFWVPRDFLWQ